MEDRQLGKTTLVEDITNMMYSITTEAAEKFDEFVFTTVQPYCEKQTQLHVSKEQLIKALTKQKPMEPESFMDGLVKRYSCKTCGKHLVSVGRYHDDYCSKCGQAVKWE